MIDLNSFPENINVVVIGASGGIGGAFVDLLVKSKRVSQIYAFSHSGEIVDDAKVIKAKIDLTDEKSIQKAAQSIEGECHLILVATGVLQGEGFQPEKGLRDLTQDNLQNIMNVNFVGPALIGKCFLSLLPKNSKSVFAVLSARVGSISDNQLGGWYSYRASKAALNMFVKTASIEVARKSKQAVLIGLHPGTVETSLSEPFKNNVPNGKLFTPEYSAKSMLDVIDQIDSRLTGRLLAYDGQEIQP